jgi:cellulose biosynthesis protein BcsQ
MLEGHFAMQNFVNTNTFIIQPKTCRMENLVVNPLSNEALQELKEMERNKKIKILNEEEVDRQKARKEQMLKEVDNYTYENILKNLKNSDS